MHWRSICDIQWRTMLTPRKELVNTLVSTCTGRYTCSYSMTQHEKGRSDSSRGLPAKLLQRLRNNAQDIRIVQGGSTLKTREDMSAKRLANQICLGYPGRRCRTNVIWIGLLFIGFFIAALNILKTNPISGFTKVYLRQAGPPGAYFANQVLSGNALPAKMGTPLTAVNFSQPSVVPDSGQKQPGSGTLSKHRTSIGTCTKPIDNIAFLKVHKCASSSVANIMVRYGLRKDLNFALPKLDNGHIGWPNSFQPTHALNVQEDQPINIIAYHIIYNKENVAKIMPKDTKVVGILREPWAQFKSSMNFFRELKQIKFNTKDTVTEFLNNPKKYEKKLLFALGGKRLGYKSVTHNFLSSEMGLPESYYNDEGKIREYIKFLDESVDLVMMKEHFSQSIVLLRRLMCWDMSDVITMPINSKKYKLNHQEAALKEKHQKWSAADYLLYDHFNRTFHKKVQAEGKGFFDEVRQFDKLNLEVEQYCKQNKSTSPLTLAPSAWNSAIKITREGCKMLKVIPYYMTGMIKRKMVALKNKRKGIKEPPPPPAKKTAVKPAPVKTVPKEAPVKTVVKEAPVKRVVKEVPVDAVAKEAQVETVVKPAPLETVAKLAPAEMVAKEAPVEAVAKKASVETVAKQAPIETVAKQAAGIAKPAAAETVGKQAPVEAVVKNEPLAKVPEVVAPAGPAEPAAS